MEPIELEPVTISDKEVVYRQLEAARPKAVFHGAIIDDHGGDVAGGVEMFRKTHPETIEIYDITHKAACMLKRTRKRRDVESIRGEGRSDQMQHPANGIGISGPTEPTVESAVHESRDIDRLGIQDAGDSR